MYRRSTCNAWENLRIFFFGKEVPHIIVTHCFLHRHALASKILSSTLKEILFTSVMVANFVRAQALNHCIFKKFCQKMGVQHEDFLYHTEVR